MKRFVLGVTLLAALLMGSLAVARGVEQAGLPVVGELKQALSDQMKEYDAIESQAHDLARERGWQVEELDPGVRRMAQMMTSVRLQGRNLDSRIAAMMMKGNNRGIIKGYKNIHRYHGRDPRIMALSQKLIDCESENIKQMEGFL